MNAKISLLLAALLSASATFNFMNAQVTIGSGTAPHEFSILEVVSSSAKTGGLRLPHLSATDKQNLQASLIAKPTESKGLLIYNTTDGQLEYWDGTKWVMAKMAEPWMVSGGTDAATLNTQDIYQMGTVTVGAAATADPTAILNIISDSKGVLLPRITLKSPTDIVTIKDPTVGLLVFNTGTNPTFGVQGYMYWSGSEWKVFDSSTAIPPTITYLLCGGATISPARYIAGAPYSGVMKIPYTGGNGGRYTSGTSYIDNGLTFKLQDGKLENGSGELVFNVSGTPINSSPIATTIVVNNSLVPFYSGNCTAKVGDIIAADITSNAVMDQLTFTNEGRDGYAVKITTPDGKFSIRCYLPTGTAISNVNLQVRANNSNPIDLISNTTYFWGGGSSMMHNQLRVQPNVWSGSGGDAAALQLATVQTSANFPAWGDAGVYAGSMPEFRQYVWTTHGDTEKVFYTMKFMMGALQPGMIANAANCPNGMCPGTKVFFTIEQVTAP